MCINENSVGCDWEFENWRKEINQSISMFGLDKWRKKIDNKATLKYFKEEIAPRKEMYKMEVMPVNFCLKQGSCL